MIKLTKRILQQALDHSATGTVIVDSAGRRIVYANDAMERLLGWTPDALVGKTLDNLMVAGDPLPIGAKVAPPDTLIYQQWRCAHGPNCELQWQASALTDADDRPAFWLLTVLPDQLSDSLSTYDETRSRITQTDAATGLPTRKVFEEMLMRDWAVARRVRRRVSIMVFRVDAFDGYQKVFGRHAGDSCLRKIAHAIHGSIRRESDFAARFAADQFAVLTAGSDEKQLLEFAKNIAEKVRLLAIHHPRSPVDRFATVSYAVAAQTPQLRASYEMLINTALEDLGEPVEALATCVERRDTA